MNVSDAAVSLSTPLNVSACAAAPSHSASVTQAGADPSELRSGPRMQSLGLTSLKQTVLQGINDQVRSHFLPSMALHIKDSTKDKAFGAVLAVGGAAAKVAGKQLAGLGGVSSKVAGSVLMWGGKAAEKVGKNTYQNAEPKKDGNYNAFAARNWAR